MTAYLVNHPGVPVTKARLAYAFDTKADADIMRHIYIEHLGVDPKNVEIAKVEVSREDFEEAKKNR